MIGTSLALSNSVGNSTCRPQQLIEDDVILQGPVLLDESADDAADGTFVESLRQALRGTGYVVLRNLNVEVEAGHVKLGGRVPTYHLKQLAQSAVKRVPGVAVVVNNIEVV